jgi:hypothetical protein
MIEQAMCRVKVTDHDWFILGYVLQETRVKLMVLPHLHNVDDLPNVIAWALNNLLNHVSLYKETLFLANALNSPSDTIFWRLVKL